MVKPMGWIDEMFLKLSVWLFVFIVGFNVNHALADNFTVANDAFTKGDVERANKIWTELSQKGHAGAQYELGQSYLQGQGVAKNPTKAYQLFKEAADGGQSDAQALVCHALAEGYVEVGIPRVVKDSIFYCEKAARSGEFLAQFVLFKIYRYPTFGGELANNENAFYWAEIASSNTSPGNFASWQRTMLYELGLMYFEGIGTKIDVSKAMMLYTKSAIMGEPVANFALGNMYEFGVGEISSDKRKAYDYYVVAAKQGYVHSFVNLGLMYKNGDGIQQDLLKANMWMAIGAIHEDDFAIQNLQRWSSSGLIDEFKNESQREVLRATISQCIESRFVKCLYD